MAWFFAWTNAGTEWSASLERVDADFYEVVISQTEGDVASATVVIDNPSIGLLAASRKRWAWLAWDDGSTVTPLFYGRMVGTPDQIQGETIRLDFLARPNDFVEQKEALADTLRVLPYYDPVWIKEDRRDDPDAVLEGYSKHWHVDRTSHVVSVSDIVSGEDGTLEFDGSQILADTLDQTYSTSPVRHCRAEGTVQYDQVASGSIDLSQMIAEAAGEGTRFVRTLTGEGLIRDWPKEGARIGSGWSVGESEGIRLEGSAVVQEWIPTGIPPIMGDSESKVETPVWTVLPVFHAAYDAERSRSETVTFTLTADVQPVIYQQSDQEVLRLSVSSPDVADDIEVGGGVPIGDARRPSYFRTLRGKQSVKALAMMARARLLYRARCVEVSFDVAFADALNVTLRKNATVYDDRLPGGAATGKIIGYSFSSVDGVNVASVRMGCSVGAGNSIAEVVGSPVYVEDGVLEDGIQARDGATEALDTGDMTVESYFDTEVDDDGVNFFQMRASDLAEVDVIFPLSGQREVVELRYPDTSAMVTALNGVYTEIDVTLTPLNVGPFHTDFAVMASDLMVPTGIDLEHEGSA